MNTTLHLSFRCFLLFSIVFITLKVDSISAQTWENHGPYVTQLQLLVPDPDTPLGAWVAHNSQLKYTDNGGQTWGVRENGLPDIWFHNGPLLINPTNGDTLLYHGLGLEFSRSVDHGLSWSGFEIAPQGGETYGGAFVHPASGLPFFATTKAIYEFDSWSAFPTRSFLLDDHPDLAGSHIRAIIPHPSDPTIYFISNSLYIVEVHVDTNTIEFIYTAGDSDLPDLGTITLTSPTGNPDWLIGEGTSWTYEPLGLVETLDGGESWQYGSSFPCEYGSWVEPGGRVYAPGDEGLLYSDNQAETWHTLIPSSQLPPAYHTFEHGRVAVAPSDSSVVWIAPYYNEFYRTENRGESWQLIEALQTFTTPTIITTGHSDSEVVYASQGIQLWSLLDQDEDIWELRSIIPSFVSRLQLSADNQTLFRAFHWTNPEDVYGGEIGRSNDGGWTWEWQNQFLLESLPNNLSNAAMHPTGPDTIYAILDDQSIQSFKTFCRSEDFGQVWQQSSGIPWTSCIDRYIYVDPYHPERVYVWLGQNLYRSLDHGRSFEQLSELVGVFFRPNSRSLIGATTTTIKVSDDEGDNWQELDPPPGYGDIQRVSHLPGTELGLLVVREDGIWSSWHTDVDWQPVVLPFVAEDLTSSVAFSADETLYVGHEGIWVGRDVVSVDENNSPIPNTHDLNINIYPNPFNGSAVLQYSLPSPSTVRIQIFDILGRIVLTLPYNKQYQGTQTIPLDISSHPSGTYFVSIDMGESNYGIKKLILIK